MTLPFPPYMKQAKVTTHSEVAVGGRDMKPVAVAFWIGFGLSVVISACLAAVAMKNR